MVYKFKKLIGRKYNLYFQFMLQTYRINLNVIYSLHAYFFNPIMVDNFAAFFNCTPVGRASNSMMAPTYSYSF